MFTNLFQMSCFGIVKNETVGSRFDRDGLQSREITCAYESDHVACDLYRRFDKPESRRRLDSTARALRTRANTLGFPSYGSLWSCGARELIQRTDSTRASATRHQRANRRPLGEGRRPR